MKITAKLVLSIILGFFVILMIDGYISVQREVALFHDNKENKARQIGFALKGLISEVWNISGEEQALKLISDANVDHESFRISWIWLDSKLPSYAESMINDTTKALIRKGNVISIKHKDKTGAKYLFTYIPINLSTNRYGALEISQSLSDLEHYSRITIYKTIGVIGATLLVSGILFSLLSFWLIGQPLRVLKEKIDQIGEGNLTTTIAIHNRDEFTELGDTLNSLCKNLLRAQNEAHRQARERMKTLEQLRHSDRLKTIGIISSGIAHELGTPLNVVSGRAELIISQNSGLELINQSATIIKEQAQRMTAIIKQLLDYARNDSPRKTQLDLKQMVTQSLDMLEPIAHKKDIHFEVISNVSQVTAIFDSTQMQQVMTNLLTNAINAMPDGGTIEIGISREFRSHAGHPDREAEAFAAIYVKDEGIGIAKEVQSTIFDPFFTTNKPGYGTGLGLSIAQSIIHEHGGWIDVVSEKDVGSCFKCYIKQGDTK